MKFKTMTAVAAMTMLSACNNGAADKGATDVAASDAPAAAASGAPAPASAIAVQAMTEADRQPFGLGFSCSLDNDSGTFLQTGILPDPEGGTNNLTRAALRVNGELVSCTADQETGSQLARGEGAFQCGNYAVSLMPKGPESTDADDAGRPVTMTVERGTDRTTVDGNVDCAI